MSLTCFQTPPVNLFEKDLFFKFSAVVVFEPEAFHWVLLHQAFAKSLCLFAKFRRICNGIIYDSTTHLVILDLKNM